MGTEDMFARCYLALLREAIHTMAGDKYGLKQNLNVIIIRMMKSLKGMYAEEMDEAKCHELDMFTDTYKW